VHFDVPFVTRDTPSDQHFGIKTESAQLIQVHY